MVQSIIIGNWKLEKLTTAMSLSESDLGSKEFYWPTRIVITHGLYTFYPLLKSKSIFSRAFFLKILAWCMVSNQEQFLIKSRLWWPAYGIQTVSKWLRPLLPRQWSPIWIVNKQRSTPVLIKIPHASNLSFTGQWQGPEIRTHGHGNNKLEGTRAKFSA